MKRHRRKKHTKRRSKRGGVLGDPPEIRVFDKQLDDAKIVIDAVSELPSDSTEFNENMDILREILGYNVGLAGQPVSEWKPITWRDENGTIKTYTPWIGDGVNSLEGIRLWAQGHKSQNSPIYLVPGARSKKAQLLIKVTGLYDRANELYKKYKEKAKEAKERAKERAKVEQAAKEAKWAAETPAREAADKARRVQLLKENKLLNDWQSELLAKINYNKNNHTELISILDKEQKTLADEDNNKLKDRKASIIKILRDAVTPTKEEMQRQQQVEMDTLIGQETKAAADKAPADKTEAAEKAAAEKNLMAATNSARYYSDRENLKEQLGKATAEGVDVSLRNAAKAKISELEKEEEDRVRGNEDEEYIDANFVYGGGRRRKAKKSKKKRKRSRRARRTRK